MDGSKLFSTGNSSRTRSNIVKLRCKQIQLDSTKFYLTNDVVGKWNKLPHSLVQCDTINSFKDIVPPQSKKINKILKINLVNFAKKFLQLARHVDNTFTKFHCYLMIFTMVISQHSRFTHVAFVCLFMYYLVIFPLLLL